MGETLEALRHLQNVEQQLAQFRQGESKRQRQVRLHKRSIARCQEQVEARREDLRSHQIEADQLDLSVKTREAAMAKYREALNRAKTNKEYSAILSTINTEKADHAKKEGRYLEVASRMDTVRADIGKEEEQQSVHRQRLAEAEDRLREYLDRTADERSALETQRAEAATNISPQALASFNRSAERHDGEALAPIVRLHPKREEHVCGGCNMKVTLEVVSVLQSRDELRTCSACGRIVYLDS